MQTNQKIIVITAPSGAGKTSITKYLLQNFPQLRFSISATTRASRSNEIDGQDYHFLTVEQFKNHIDENDFFEWEMVYQDKYYGTLKSEIHRIWAQGNVPLLDIDVKGAIHVQQQFHGHVLSIFIEAPSLEELKKRLENRGTETPETLAMRLNKASYEMSFKNNFDYEIVNDNLARAVQETEKVVSHFLKQN